MWLKTDVDVEYLSWEVTLDVSVTDDEYFAMLSAPVEISIHGICEIV